MIKWDDEDGAAEPTRVGVSVGKKWDDEEEDDVLESWDAAEDSEEEREKEEKANKAAAAAAAAKKSKTERIAEKQAENAAKKAVEEAEKSALADETPEERRRRVQQQEIDADLNHAVDLFAGAVVEDIADHGVTSVPTPSPAPPSGAKHKSIAIAIADPEDSSKSIDLSTLSLFNPTTKKQFTDLQNTLAPLLAQNVKKPDYPLFVQELTRLLIKDMSSEQIRKVASTCTTLTNEKLRDEKAAEKGVKKTKAQKTKTTLVGVGGKDNNRLDLKTYDDFDE
ncbi:translation initiation factor eIF3 subunit [Terfezia boudieri ATCC MYA-4762]|uniref:Eukaryotic translation initiation factor 3 subunit J n=1 Tax=Terfezia boudieri ATCC MYA-4762 TaxID=1051890 RepID=A0A3N4LPL4_9PEZI|nr:translation initiation factor eIF3 subunit [Terfezia boudieri ATCC MYA-4762]